MANPHESALESHHGGHAGEDPAAGLRAEAYEMPGNRQTVVTIQMSDGSKRDFTLATDASMENVTVPFLVRDSSQLRKLRIGNTDAYCDKQGNVLQREPNGSYLRLLEYSVPNAPDAPKVRPEIPPDKIYNRGYFTPFKLPDGTTKWGEFDSTGVIQTGPDVPKAEWPNFKPGLFGERLEDMKAVRLKGTYYLVDKKGDVIAQDGDKLKLVPGWKVTFIGGSAYPAKYFMHDGHLKLPKDNVLEISPSLTEITTEQGVILQNPKLHNASRPYEVTPADRLQLVQTDRGKFYVTANGHVLSRNSDGTYRELVEYKFTPSTPQKGSADASVLLAGMTATPDDSGRLPAADVAFASESVEGKAEQLRISLEALKLGDLRNMLRDQDLTAEDLRVKLGLPENFAQNTTAEDRVDITKLVALEYGTELASKIMAGLFGAAQ
jgi:hypothetical protein